MSVIVSIAKLSGYCIKHCERHLFFADDTGRTTEDFDCAAIYESRLAANIKCAEFFKLLRIEQFEDAEWRIIRRAVVQKATPLNLMDLPFALHITDPLQAVNVVYDLHNLYSRRIDNWLRNAGVKDVPQQATVKMTITAPKWAGTYCPKEHECHYPVVYAMMADDFHKVVAHEVVHSYQRAFCGRKVEHGGHGNDFYALMLHAAQEPVTKHTHDYSTKEAHRLSESLLKWWKEQGQQGLLASLPVEVVTQPMKRKGIE